MNITAELLGLSETDWITIVGVVAGAIVGYVISLIQRRRARERPQLRFAVDFDILVDPADGLLNQGLSMTFRNDRVERISRSYIAVWHSAGDTVDSNDVVGSDPLRIELDGGDLPLQTRVVYRSRSAILLTSRIDDDVVLLDFAFLEAGDGGVIEVLHRGRHAPKLVGTVKSASMRQLGGSAVALTPASLEWMRHGGRLDRVRKRLSGRSTKAAALEVAMLLVLFLGVLWALSFLIVTEVLRTPRLVDTNKYNLTTLQGQYDFSTNVTASGLVPSDVYVVIVGFCVAALLMVLFGLFTAIGRVRAPVPRSILRESHATDGDLLARQPIRWSSAERSVVYQIDDAIQESEKDDANVQTTEEGVESNRG